MVQVQVSLCFCAFNLQSIMSYGIQIEQSMQLPGKNHTKTGRLVTTSSRVKWRPRLEAQTHTCPAPSRGRTGFTMHYLYNVMHPLSYLCSSVYVAYEFALYFNRCYRPQVDVSKILQPKRDFGHESEYEGNAIAGKVSSQCRIQIS